MSYASLPSLFRQGRENYRGQLEVQLLRGLPSFDLSGLAGAALKEAPARLRAAFAQTGLDFPRQRILLSFLPASRPKDGSHYDLAIAVLILKASGQLVISKKFQQALILGELAFSGELQALDRAKSLLQAAELNGFKDLIVPEKSLAELHRSLSRESKLRLWPVKDLAACLDLLAGYRQAEPQYGSKSSREERLKKLRAEQLSGIAEIPSQSSMLRALAIAAAGWHPTLILGAPGSGKTYLAERITAFMSPLSEQEARELSALASYFPEKQELSQGLPPFITCHHSVSPAALIGGGTPIHAGLISAAHRGVLFLDELTEFPKAKLDLLRQALTDAYVDLARGEERLRLPADFLLLAAANPCPCGYYLEAGKCLCTTQQVERYLSKISGPLWDRFQLMVTAQSLAEAEFSQLLKGSSVKSEESTAFKLLEQVKTASAMQAERADKYALAEKRNGRVSLANPAKVFAVDRLAEKSLVKIAEHYSLSARGLQNLLAVARTIADLEAKEQVSEAEVLAAATYLPIRQNS
ncbi:MAG: ATP-binding protein [Eubacteriales bacterium]|nr:ATP-binding protein [Eubacteriales bacterium]